MKEINTYDEYQQPIVIRLDEEEEPWPKNVPRKGDPLYYKDKRTREVKEGFVCEEGRFRFNFRFYDMGYKVVRLPVDVIGNSIIYSCHIISLLFLRVLGCLPYNDGTLPPVVLYWAGITDICSQTTDWRYSEAHNA